MCVSKCPTYQFPNSAKRVPADSNYEGSLNTRVNTCVLILKRQLNDLYYSRSAKISSQRFHSQFPVGQCVVLESAVTDFMALQAVITETSSYVNHRIPS